MARAKFLIRSTRGCGNLQRLCAAGDARCRAVSSPLFEVALGVIFDHLQAIAELGADDAGVELR